MTDNILIKHIDYHLIFTAEMMDDRKREQVMRRLAHLFKKAESSQPSGCCRAMEEIRARFVPCKPYLALFIEQGGLKTLVAQLQKDDKKLVNVSLSILSHCVLEPGPRITVSLSLNTSKCHTYWCVLLLYSLVNQEACRFWFVS